MIPPPLLLNFGAQEPVELLEPSFKELKAESDTPELCSRKLEPEPHISLGIEQKERENTLLQKTHPS